MLFQFTPNNKLIEILDSSTLYSTNNKNIARKGRLLPRLSYLVFLDIKSSEFHLNKLMEDADTVWSLHGNNNNKPARHILCGSQPHDLRNDQD